MKCPNCGFNIETEKKSSPNPEDKNEGMVCPKCLKQMKMHKSQEHPGLIHYYCKKCNVMMDANGKELDMSFVEGFGSERGHWILNELAVFKETEEDKSILNET